MRFEKLDNWDPHFRHDGILYFAQRVQEMLFHYTSHVYKRPVLNTLLLAKEYINNTKLVENGSINENNLKYIMEEFQNSFINDIVIQNKLDNDTRKQLLQELNSAKSENKRKIMEYVLYVLRDYDYWCKEYIQTIVLQEREKKKIERALRSYIPGLIGAGYSPEYIYYYNQEIFFRKHVESTNVLGTFLNRFDFKENEYTVYLPIAKWANTFKEILEKRLHVKFVSNKQVKDLRFSKDKYRAVRIKVIALDERTAAGIAYNHIHTFFKYYKFLSDEKSSWIYNMSKVVDASGNTSFMSLIPKGYNVAGVNEKEDVGEVSEWLITALLINATDMYSTIEQLVDIHNTAIDEKNLKNGYLNFWSILEILFVTGRDESKINEIETKMLPMMRADYIRTLFDELREYILENLSKETLELIKTKRHIDFDEIENVFSFITLPEYNDFRNELYDLFKDSPLIRTRISLLNQMFSNKENLEADLNRYEKRVSWHIRRLYRTRNTLIHTGEVPDNLKELGEHLHSYVDACIIRIAVALARKNSLISIENVIIDSKFNMELFANRINGRGPVNQDDIAFIVKYLY